MKKINIRKTVAGTALAAAAAGAISLGAGTAAAETAGVPDGQYNLVVGSPINGLTAPGIGQTPVTIKDGVLTVAGQSGRLTPTADGAKAVIAGQPVRLTGFDGQYGVEVLGSTWGQLHRR
ncbi:hypothetical protein GCM10010528_23270 [Gordonia defluvii]|uniref:Uncharacterized protein n=1 Tax=Gordonia defluvii TaxID=283718 RepID=A0ABP6LGI4_9ACTN